MGQKKAIKKQQQSHLKKFMPTSLEDFGKMRDVLEKYPPEKKKKEEEVRSDSYATESETE